MSHIGRASRCSDHGFGRADGSVHKLDGHRTSDRAHPRPTVTGGYADELGSPCWMSTMGKVLCFVGRWRGGFHLVLQPSRKELPGGPRLIFSFQKEFPSYKRSLIAQGRAFCATTAPQCRIKIAALAVDFLRDDCTVSKTTKAPSQCVLTLIVCYSVHVSGPDAQLLENGDPDYSPGAQAA